MKRLLLISAAFFLLVTLAGCGQKGSEMTGESIDINEGAGHGDEDEIFVSWIEDQLEFSSIEALLASYLIVKEGRADGDIRELVSGWDTSRTEWGASFSDSGLIYVAESTDFTSLETFHLPVGIPEEFQIYRITVDEEYVSIWYLHEDDMVSEDTRWDAIVQQRHFLYGFSRRNLEIPIDGNPMEGILRQNNATEEDLIDGKYLFVAPNLFLWATEKAIFMLYTPLPPRVEGEFTIDEDGLMEFVVDDTVESHIWDFVVNTAIPADSADFAETVAVDLSDTGEVLELIEETNLELVSKLVDELEFSSLEEFLGSYLIATEDSAEGDIADLVEDWSPAFTDSDFAYVVEGTALTSLETLYLPTSIPEEFQLYRMAVNERFVSNKYLHEDDMVSEDATQDAIEQGQYFLFNVSRRDADAATLMEGVLQRNRATEEDLIDGNYLFVAPNRFVWVSDGAIFRLTVPLSMIDSADDMIAFTEIDAVDLLDTYEVMELIEETNLELVSKLVDELEFSSLEEFLGSYLITRGEGAEGDIAELVEDWNPAFTGSDFADVVEATELAFLETLYLPIGIPEGFQLHRVTINERNVAFRYLHEDDLVSENAIQDAIEQGRYFLFNVSRRDADAATLMEGVLRRNRATEEDLIDGNYLVVAPNRFVWVSDGAISRLSAPLSMIDSADDTESFTEIAVVNLLDTNKVMELIGEDDGSEE